jgi:hypothetical protein
MERLRMYSDQTVGKLILGMEFASMHMKDSSMEKEALGTELARNYTGEDKVS